MSKKLVILLLLVIWGGLLFPLSISAEGTYYACPPTNPFYDDKTDKCCTSIHKTTGACGAPINPETVCYKGFVPCGKQVLLGGRLEQGECVAGTPTEVHCQFCHLFIMIEGIIAYFLIYIVPPLAVLMIVIGGVMFYLGGAKPELLGKGKTLIKGVVIGLFLIYGAYMIIGLFLVVLGAADISPVQNLFKDGVFSVKCPIEIYPPRNP